MNPPIRRPQSGKTRALIGEVAIRMFEARGFEEVTIDEIAAEMGISRRTIFRHFPMKVDIVLEPVKIGFRALPDGLRAQPRDMPLGQALGSSLDVLLAGLGARRELLARHLRLVMGSTTLRTVSRSLMDAAIKDLRQEIASRLDGSETSMVEASVWADMMYVIAYGGRERWLLYPEQDIGPAMAQSRAAVAKLAAMLSGQNGEVTPPAG